MIPRPERDEIHRLAAWEAALIDGTEEALRNYARAWGVALPEDDAALEAAIHETRVAHEDLPVRTRQTSERWLERRAAAAKPKQVARPKPTPKAKPVKGEAKPVAPAPVAAPALPLVNPLAKLEK